MVGNIGSKLKGWVNNAAAVPVIPQPATVNIQTPSTAPTTTFTNVSISNGTSGIISNTLSPFTFSYAQPAVTNIISLRNSNGEIVVLNTDGSVTWADGIQIDEAAEAFSKSLSLSAEISSGITKKVKQEMRDTVFNEIISIAKEKGPLTADELTYLLQAAKIMDKLRGGRE